MFLLTGVPRVVTVRPRQLRLEAVEQVEERPGKDDDVVDAAVQDHHLAGVAETCSDTQGVAIYTMQTPPPAATPLESPHILSSSLESLELRMKTSFH